MNKSNQHGITGEVIAAKFLTTKGYDIVALNYRSCYGEIDIIASNDEYIVFVEVKSREQDAYFLPREAVTKKKQKNIIKTAMQYLGVAEPKLQPRFDVIEVYTNYKNKSEKIKINHIKNAFWAEGYV